MVKNIKYIESTESVKTKVRKRLQKIKFLSPSLDVGNIFYLYQSVACVMVDGLIIYDYMYINFFLWPVV